MEAERAVLDKIKALIKAKKYRIRLHAVRHMIEEGFDENSLLGAMEGESHILETYPSEMRCLILGYFAVSEKVRQPIHLVCDYSSPRLVDIVTAYLPQRPWWITPNKRGRVT